MADRLKTPDARSPEYVARLLVRHGGGVFEAEPIHLGEQPWIRLTAAGVPGDQVALTFGDRGGVPSIWEIRNYSDRPGWGRAMVTLLRTVYGCDEWFSTDIKHSGVTFWHKMQREFGFRLNSLSGHPILPADVAEARIAHIRSLDDGAWAVVARTETAPIVFHPLAPVHIHGGRPCLACS